MANRRLFFVASFCIVFLVVADGSQSFLWGGRTGEEFSDGLSRGIRQIHLRHGSKIDMLKVEYDQDGVRIGGGQHGGNGGTKVQVAVTDFSFYPSISATDCMQITLNYPDEYLFQVAGTFDKTINSLIFFTRRKSNDARKQYGPFGKMHGNYFRTGQGKIVGFFGRSGKYLDAVGIYFEDPCRNRTSSN